MPIRNLIELGAHLGCEPTLGSIRRRLYKDTECGIGFSADETGVVVSGYCEGDVGDCPSYHLDWGFTENDFGTALELADKDGCDLWDATHGCEDCNTEEIDGYRPIDPNCKSCGGDGQVI